MYFESIEQLLHMDGHGVFVWSAYAISAFVVVASILQPWLRYRSELRRLAKTQRAQQAQRDGGRA